MIKVDRRKAIEVLGKSTAALGAGLSLLGSGCAKKEEAPTKAQLTREERIERAKKYS